MEHSNFKSEQYKANFDKDEVIKEVESFLSMDLKLDGYEVQEENGERGGTLFAKPNSINKPYFHIQKTNVENGVKRNIILGWTVLNEKGEMPDAVHSQSAYREGGLPAIISLVELNGEIKLKEVLFTEEKGFERFIFDKLGNIDSKWFFMKKEGENKIYEMKRPLFVKFYTNGNPKEVWYSNPSAKNFIETSCTLRMTDDHPVVLSFYETGEIEKVDYTGYTFADTNVPHTIENFPFHSRYRFYLPSYYYYSPKNEFGRQSTIMTKYFLHKEDTEKDEVEGIIESYGLDASDPDSVDEMLQSNPIFENMIRKMFSISVVTDKQLDETIMLHTMA